MPRRERDDQLAVNDRRRAYRHDQAAIRRARERRDGALDLAGVGKSIGLNSTPSGGATAWMMAHCPTPADTPGSRMTATRVTRARSP